jgi:hypothetical protein
VEGGEANGGDERNPVRFLRTATSFKLPALTSPVNILNTIMNLLDIIFLNLKITSNPTFLNFKETP